MTGLSENGPNFHNAQCDSRWYNSLYPSTAHQNDFGDANSQNQRYYAAKPAEEQLMLSQTLNCQHSFEGSLMNLFSLTTPRPASGVIQYEKQNMTQSPFSSWSVSNGQLQQSVDHIAESQMITGNSLQYHENYNKTLFPDLNSNTGDRLASHQTVSPTRFQPPARQTNFLYSISDVHNMPLQLNEKQFSSCHNNYSVMTQLQRRHHGLLTSGNMNEASISSLNTSHQWLKKYRASSHYHHISSFLPANQKNQYMMSTSIPFQNNSTHLQRSERTPFQNNNFLSHTYCRSSAILPTNVSCTRGYNEEKSQMYQRNNAMLHSTPCHQNHHYEHASPTNNGQVKYSKTSKPRFSDSVLSTTNALEYQLYKNSISDLVDCADNFNVQKWYKMPSGSLDSPKTSTDDNSETEIVNMPVDTNSEVQCGIILKEKSSVMMNSSSPFSPAGLHMDIDNTPSSELTEYSSVNDFQTVFDSKKAELSAQIERDSDPENKENSILVVPRAVKVTSSNDHACSQDMGDEDCLVIDFDRLDGTDPDSSDVSKTYVLSPTQAELNTNNECVSGCAPDSSLLKNKTICEEQFSDDLLLPVIKYVPRKKYKNEVVSSVSRNRSSSLVRLGTLKKQDPAGIENTEKLLEDDSKSRRKVLNDTVNDGSHIPPETQSETGVLKNQVVQKDEISLNTGTKGQDENIMYVDQSDCSLKLILRTHQNNCFSLSENSQFPNKILKRSCSDSRYDVSGSFSKHAKTTHQNFTNKHITSEKHDNVQTEKNTCQTDLFIGNSKLITSCSKEMTGFGCQVLKGNQFANCLSTGNTMTVKMSKGKYSLKMGRNEKGIGKSKNYRPFLKKPLKSVKKKIINRIVTRREKQSNGNVSGRAVCTKQSEKITCECCCLEYDKVLIYRHSELRLVKYHGSKLLCLNLPEGKYFIMKEFVCKCFTASKQKVYQVKSKILHIGYYELQHSCRTEVIEYLMEINKKYNMYGRKALADMTAGNVSGTFYLDIILVKDANRLYHYINGEKPYTDYEMTNQLKTVNKLCEVETLTSSDKTSENISVIKNDEVCFQDPKLICSDFCKDTQNGSEFSERCLLENGESVTDDDEICSVSSDSTFIYCGGLAITERSDDTSNSDKTDSADNEKMFLENEQESATGKENRVLSGVKGGVDLVDGVSVKYIIEGKRKLYLLSDLYSVFGEQQVLSVVHSKSILLKGCPQQYCRYFAMTDSSCDHTGCFLLNDKCLHVILSAIKSTKTEENNDCCNTDENRSESPTNRKPHLYSKKREDLLKNSVGGCGPHSEIEQTSEITNVSECFNSDTALEGSVKTVSLNFIANNSLNTENNCLTGNHCDIDHSPDDVEVDILEIQSDDEHFLTSSDPNVLNNMNKCEVSLEKEMYLNKIEENQTDSFSDMNIADQNNWKDCENKERSQNGLSELNIIQDENGLFPSSDTCSEIEPLPLQAVTDINSDHTLSPEHAGPLTSDSTFELEHESDEESKCDEENTESAPVFSSTDMSQHQTICTQICEENSSENKKMIYETLVTGPKEVILKSVVELYEKIEHLQGENQTLNSEVARISRVNENLVTTMHHYEVLLKEFAKSFKDAEDE